MFRVWAESEQNLTRCNPQDELKNSSLTMSTSVDCMESSACILQPEVDKLVCTFENWLKSRSHVLNSSLVRLIILIQSLKSFW